jgi:hypothetical protein
MLRFAYSSGHCLLILLYGPETERQQIKDDKKIKRKTNLDRRGPRPLPTICHLPDPPSFSLPTTFNVCFFIQALLPSSIIRYPLSAPILTGKSLIQRRQVPVHILLDGIKQAPLYFLSILPQFPASVFSFTRFRLSP